MNLSDPHELATLLEGILLAAGKPLSLERLAELFDEAERPEPGQFRDALAILALSCAGRSFELKEVASGYRLQIRERFSPWVGRLWEERPQRYSRAVLETLVLIAYRQPITRGEIEEIRGVAVNTQIVKTLMEREWIRIVGYREVPGRPAMLATTKAFLDYFNLKSLDELPPLSALREMEPEPEPPVEVAPAAQPPRDDLDEDAIPASIQALADRAIAEAGESLEEIEGEAGEPEKPREETSFRSLLLELDEMEQGLKTDFDDLLDPPEPSEQGDESAEPAAGPIPVVAEQAVEPAVAEAVAGADPDDEERALAEAMREEREALDADDWPRRCPSFHPVEFIRPRRRGRPAPFHRPWNPPMKETLNELITLISTGCMGAEEIRRIADEAAQAYADPAGFLAANPDINYDDSFPIPLGEWVVVGSLPDIVLFQADTYAELFARIVASFGKDVAFNIKPKQLLKTEPLVALNRIQVQLSSMYPEKGGYVLVDFSEPLDDELQAVLVYTQDLPRVMALCVEAGIYAAPAYESLRDAEAE